MRVGQDGERPTEVKKHLRMDCCGIPNPGRHCRREKLDCVAVCKVRHCSKYKSIYRLIYSTSERIHK